MKLYPIINHTATVFFGGHKLQHEYLLGFKHPFDCLGIWLKSNLKTTYQKSNLNTTYQKSLTSRLVKQHYEENQDIQELCLNFNLIF
jgi:hypothetical protein